jgi:hypothetical protein
MQRIKKQKLYVLALKNRSENYISKIGETKDDLTKRIVGFGFGGKWKGREKDVEIILELDTLLGKALEDIVKSLLQKNWKDNQLKDKNLGRGYTEWYFMNPSSMVGLVMVAFKKLYNEDNYLSLKLKGVNNGK